MRKLLIPVLALIAVPTATAAFSVTLNTTSPQTFAAITLSGVDQTKTLPLSITVVNTGGTNGTGWSVTAAAGVPTSGTNTLSALQVTAVSAAAGPWAAATGAPATVSHRATSVARQTDAIVLQVGDRDDDRARVHAGLGQMPYDAKALPGTYAASLTVAGSTSP